MKLTEEIKEEIKREAENFKKSLMETEGINEYGLKEGERGDRDKLGQFFTPPVLCCQLLEMYDCTLEEFATKTILDPTCGSGNLIMAALIAGISVDGKYPEKVFGNELSLKPLELCRKRFTHYCETHGLEAYGKDFWKYHLHLGNALNPDCLNKDFFVESYRYDPVKDKVTTDIKKKFSLNRRCNP